MLRAEMTKVCCGSWSVAKAWLVLERGNRRLALRHEELETLVLVGVGVV